ncbi:hypothetical protein [Aphanothece sacrum]|nr:hypothetical protein [Aphanothece sacrum]GBF84615.1 permease [Aphanothece sacrum FPU3]
MTKGQKIEDYSILFKGGYELSKSGINTQIALTLLAAIVMASK